MLLLNCCCCCCYNWAPPSQEKISIEGKFIKLGKKINISQMAATVCYNPYIWKIYKYKGIGNWFFIITGVGDDAKNFSLSLKFNCNVYENKIICHIKLLHCNYLRHYTYNHSLSDFKIHGKISIYNNNANDITFTFFIWHSHVTILILYTKWNEILLFYVWKVGEAKEKNISLFHFRALVNNKSPRAGRHEGGAMMINLWKFPSLVLSFVYSQFFYFFFFFLFNNSRTIIWIYSWLLQLSTNNWKHLRKEGFYHYKQNFPHHLI